MNDDLLSRFNLEHHHEVGTFLLLREHLRRSHAHLVFRDLKGSVTAAALPDRAVVLRTICHPSSVEVVAEVDGVCVLLFCRKASGTAWASGADAELIAAVLDEIAQRIDRTPVPGRVDVTFVDQWSDRRVSIDARPWEEMTHLYAPDVAETITSLMSHTSDPDEARRLLLWHGAPGTGKTSAIRALLMGWQDWADGVVVTDPESLLADGRYLRRVVLDADDEDERWQVLVLEDAETLLHKSTGSKQLAKLLNLGDGLLGQGLRCLFLITTNEPLHSLHPALVRPGRCLSRIEFGPLPAQQAARLLGRPVDRDMTLAEVMTAKPLSVVQEPVAVGQYL